MASHSGWARRVHALSTLRLVTPLASVVISARLTTRSSGRTYPDRLVYLRDINDDDLFRRNASNYAAAATPRRLKVFPLAVATRRHLRIVGFRARIWLRSFDGSIIDRRRCLVRSDPGEASRISTRAAFRTGKGLNSEREPLNLDRPDVLRVCL